MRPLRLELRGFTAFRETAVVDFGGRELFAITGPTGAGKSSLLDGMTWALYGQVPRVGRQTRQLLSHGEQSMSARLDFTVRGESYRVSRRAPATVGTRLEHLLADGSWRPLADRATEVTEQVTQLLGLDYATFTKTVLLPQGAFDSFLRGDDQQRRAILTRLLGLGTYEEARRLARERAARGAEAATLLAGQLDRLALASPEAGAALGERCARAEARHGALETRRERVAALGELVAALERARHVAAEAARAAGAATARAQAAAAALADTARNRDAAETERARLARELTALAYDPAKRARATRELERAQLREQAAAALERARAELAAALAAEHVATAAAGSAAAEAAAHAEAVAQQRTRLAAASSALAEAAAQGRLGTEQLGAGATEAKRASREAETKAGAQERRAEALGRLGEQLLAELAARATAEEARRAAAKAARAAAKAAAAARDALADAERAVAVAVAAREQAHRRHAAAALRQGLAPGDPCPVCGEPVAALPVEEAPDLAAADAAVGEAARRLTEARAEALRRDAEAVQGAAAEEHAADVAARGASALATHDAAIAEAGSTRDALDADAARCRAAVAEAQASAGAATARLQAAREQERALAVLLARAPAELVAAAPASVELQAVAGGAGGAPPATPPAALAPPDTLAAALRETLATREAAELDGRRAEAEARDAAARADAAEAEARARAELRARVERGCAEAGERLAALASEGEGAPLDVEALRARLAELERAERRAAELTSAAREAEAAAAGQAARHEERRAEAERAGVEAARVAAGATSAAEAATAAERDALEHAGELLSLDPESTAAAGREPVDAAALTGLLEGEARDRERAAAELAETRTLLERAQRDVAEGERMRAEVAEHRGRAALAGALEQELRGNRFIAYVQREAMAVLAQDAAARLEQLTAGRYRLVADDGEFTVVDQFNGDEQRSVRTLSGGETFLASLALALALSERLPELAGTGAAVSLESLFLDEGFGALDAESLDLAVQGLETLAGGRRMIGVISHVPELAERLPDRIEVVPGVHGSAVAGR